MEQIAAFIDAGYLFAQGSVALTGSKKPRALLTLDEAAAVKEIIAHVGDCSATARLLRVYWYDGAVGARQTLEQQKIADMADVKLRLGIVNSHGEQKGVDSLIVTDLVELARMQAISDAMLLAGDEDLRIGVEIAQRYGVRVHLLGIEPSRGSQSILLIREADTTAEWNAAKVSAFLSCVSPIAPAPVPVAVAAMPSAAAVAAAGTTPAASSVSAPAPGLKSVAESVALSVSNIDAKTIVEDWDNHLGLERSTDGRLLARARAALGRELEREEIRTLRRLTVVALRARASAT